jgi:hypothetical protein
MKKNLLYLLVAPCCLFCFTQCSKSELPVDKTKPTVVVVEPPVVTPQPLPTISYAMKPSYYELLPYTKGQILNFTLDGAKKQDYEGRELKKEKSTSHEYVDGKQYIVNVEEVNAAILPNKDSLLCMMVSINPQTKTFFVLIEDTRNHKWSYFNFVFDENGKILTEDLDYPVTLLPTFVHNNKTYQSVYYKKNFNGDELWYNNKDGVIEASLQDGRTFELN